VLGQREHTVVLRDRDGPQLARPLVDVAEDPAMERSEVLEVVAGGCTHPAPRASRRPLSFMGARFRAPAGVVRTGRRRRRATEGPANSLLAGIPPGPPESGSCSATHGRGAAPRRVHLCFERCWRELFPEQPREPSRIAVHESATAAESLWIAGLVRRPLALAEVVDQTLDVRVIV